jgi:DNA-binding Lrp family transcriptional regulator
VIAVYDTTGDYDIVTVAKFRTREELNVFIKETLKMPYVKRSVTSIALNVVKEDNRLNL